MVVQKRLIVLKCKNCQDDFKSKTVFNEPLYKFCSRKCYWVSLVGGEHSQEHKDKIKSSCVGGNKTSFKKGQTAPNKGKIFGKNPEHSKRMKGRKASIETRRKMSKIGFKNRENCAFWKGGITKKNLLIRMGIEYRLWRESVFARDNWTCQKCKKRGVELQAHHKKSFSEFPELRFAIDNGETLCVKCHRKTENYGVKQRWHNE